MYEFHHCTASHTGRSGAWQCAPSQLHPPGQPPHEPPQPSPPGWLKGLKELLSKHGILLVCDEVMAGFGRTGRWFAVDHWDVVPDLMTMTKGVCCTAAKTSRRSWQARWLAEATCG